MVYLVVAALEERPRVQIRVVRFGATSHLLRASTELNHGACPIEVVFACSNGNLAGLIILIQVLR